MVVVVAVNLEVRRSNMLCVRSQTKLGDAFGAVMQRMGSLSLGFRESRVDEFKTSLLGQLLATVCRLPIVCDLVHLILAVCAQGRRQCLTIPPRC